MRTTITALALAALAATAYAETAKTTDTAKDDAAKTSTDIPAYERIRALERLLKETIIAEVDFRETPIIEAIQYLSDQSKKAGHAVNIVLRIPPEFHARNARITMKVNDVPLVAALDFTVQAVDLAYIVEADVVVVFPAAEPPKGRLTTYWNAVDRDQLDPSLWMSLRRPLTQGLEDAFERLAADRIPTPEEFAQMDADTQRVHYDAYCLYFILYEGMKKQEKERGAAAFGKAEREVTGCADFKEFTEKFHKARKEGRHMHETMTERYKVQRKSSDTSKPATE